MVVFFTCIIISGKYLNATPCTQHTSGRKAIAISICHVFQYHGLNTMEWIIQTLRLPHYYELHTMLYIRHKLDSPDTHLQ